MSSVRDIFAADYAETPYWWRAAPPQASPGDLPARVDVLVVGAGYSGLSAALETARAGRSTLVIDTEALGHGASSRNVGFVGKTLKHSLGEIVHSLARTSASPSIARRKRPTGRFTSSSNGRASNAISIGAAG